MKYTKELLEEAVKKSLSVAGVLRYLGLKQAGGTQAYISKRIKEMNINTSHFLGQRSNRGDKHKGGPDKKHWNKILIKRQTGGRTKTRQLKRAMKEYGFEYCCIWCGNKGLWRGKPISLQIDHINRDWLDDRPENLRFLCPNCHSQTDGWCRVKS